MRSAYIPHPYSLNRLSCMFVCYRFCYIKIFRRLHSTYIDTVYGFCHSCLCIECTAQFKVNNSKWLCRLKKNKTKYIHFRRRRNEIQSKFIRLKGMNTCKNLLAIFKLKWARTAFSLQSTAIVGVSYS